MQEKKAPTPASSSESRLDDKQDIEFAADKGVPFTDST